MLNKQPMPDVKYPIDNYSSLKQAIMLWCDRDDEEFINQIPNFIDWAQKEIYRKLRIQPMLKESYLPITNGVAFLPSDFLQGDHMYFALNGVFFRETTQDEVSYKLNTDTFGSEPDINYIMGNNIEPIFCRVGKELWFYPPINADIPYQTDQFTGKVPENAVVYGYYSDPQRMTNDDDDPYLLTIAPDFFVYAACKHAATFLQDYPAADRAQKELDSILNALQEQQKQMDYVTSSLVVASGNIFDYWG